MQQPLLLDQRQAFSGIRYRPLRPVDFFKVKAAHGELFPIDYDDGFFHKATNGLDRIWSCAAFAPGPCGDEQLVGFITAKAVFLHECEATDRRHMGLLSPVVDHDLVLYILTLGVVEGFRHRGIASALIHSVCRHACDARCRAVFLHVITYNAAALSLYGRAGFACVARLPGFYYIATGRQPDPATQVYDAYLCVLYVGGQGSLASPWDMLTLAWSPLRSALCKIHSCIPSLCRLPHHHHHHHQHQYQQGQEQQRQEQQQEQQQPGQSGTPGELVFSGVSGANPSQSSSASTSCVFQPPQQLQPQVDEEQPHVHEHWAAAAASLTPPPAPPPGGGSRLRHKGASAAAAGGAVTPAPADASADEVAGGLPYQHLHLQLQRRQPSHNPHHPPQRMLQWLFNGQSRGAAPAAQQAQQLASFEEHAQ